MSPPRLRSLDELHPGDRYELGRLSLSLEEIRDFASRYDPQPFHLDEEAARDSIFGTVVAAGLLGVPAPMLLRIEAGLSIGTAGLAALAVATGALTAGLRGAGALAGLLMLPLAVPLLIFGAGAVQEGVGALKLLAAVSLLYVAGGPWVAAAAARAAAD